MIDMLMFDIVLYRYCEYCTTSTSFSSGIINIIGIGIPLLVFFITVRRDKRKEHKKKRQIQNDKLYYLASLVESSIKIAKQQNQYVAESVEKNKTSPLEFHALSILSFKDLERVVNKLNLEEYLLAYVSCFGKDTDSIKSFRNIVSQIDFLLSTFDNIIDSHAQHQKYDYERKKKLARLWQDSNSRIDSILDFSKELDSGFSKKFLELYGGFLKENENPYDLKYYHDKLIKPLHKLLVEHRTASDFDDSISQEYLILHNKVKMWLSTYLLIVNERNRFVTDLGHDNTRVANGIEKLKKNSINLLEKFYY